jgi:hypothetical protein
MVLKWYVNHVLFLGIFSLRACSKFMNNVNIYWIRTEDGNSMANIERAVTISVFVKFTHLCFCWPRLVKVLFKYFPEDSLASEATRMALLQLTVLSLASLSSAVTLLSLGVARDIMQPCLLLLALQNTNYLKFPFSCSTALLSEVSKKLRYNETSGSAYPVTQCHIQ